MVEMKRTFAGLNIPKLHPQGLVSVHFYDCLLYPVVKFHCDIFVIDILRYNVNRSEGS